ncbi:tetratricopeptide repeat protein [Nocardia sp. NPDC058176]|uniref:tetratricopeptide repeat protein n=1 Tax=Nocardia sp. NPDC058176 TaxID=3346368 RepID=UPI0036DCEC79
MGGRLALVVASQCDELPGIRDIDTLARDLLDELSTRGGWASVTADGAPLINPDHTDLRTAISDAFTTAKQQQATLLLSFLGHGHHDAAVHRFYLLAKDSPEIADGDRAIDLGYRIQTELNRKDKGKLDGLVVIVDACASGRAVDVAANEWFGVIPRNAARLELLTASADESPAYDACFTRTIIKTLRTGDPAGASQISVDSLRAPIAKGCAKQDPGHLSLTRSGAARALRGGDPSLWLVPNRALADCLTGRPSAELVDQLTRDLRSTPDISRCLAELVTHFPPRLRLAVGPSGSGKSAIMGMLVRACEPEIIPRKYIRAAVFLDAASSPLSVAEELAAQLTNTLPGFAEAAEHTAATLTEEQLRTLGALDRLVLVPFALVETTRPVHIIIDGLDQPDRGNRDALVAALGAMTSDDTVGDLCVIAGVRRGTGVEDDPHLTHGVQIAVELPSARAIVDATVSFRDGLSEADVDTTTIPDTTISGGWLISRLLTEVSQLPDNWSSATESTLSDAVGQRIADASSPATGEQHTSTSATQVDQLLAILTAVGVGPALPFELCRRALTKLGTTLSEAELRDLIASLGVLITRSAASTPNERIGLAHLAFTDPIQHHLETDIRAAHLAIAENLDPDDPQQFLDYRAKSGARHLALGGRSSEALKLVDSLDSDRPADNLARWTALLPEIAPTAHSEVLTTRNNIASWLGETGEPTAALAAFRQLLPDYERILGPDHPATLATRHNIAGWLGETGEPTAALAAFRQLLTDYERILGPDHPNTLTTRQWIAHLEEDLG